jgi:hypothetical protein
MDIPDVIVNGETRIVQLLLDSSTREISLNELLKIAVKHGRTETARFYWIVELISM